MLPKDRNISAASQDMSQLPRFGGWLSVSNLIGPLMVYADRFYLASIFPPAAVAYYTVPNDTLTRVSILPNTAMSAIFPAMAEAKADDKTMRQLLRKAAIAIFAMVLPPVIIGVIFAYSILSLWLGTNFATQAYPIFQILLIGIFFNSSAFLPFAYLQANGRSDLTAKLHFIEFPVFIVALYLAVAKYGVDGAAISWVIRVAMDAALLYIISAKLNEAHRNFLLKIMTLTLGFGVLMLATLTKTIF